MERMVVHAAAAFPWAYQENMEEVKQTLLHTILELESTRMAAKEERKKNEETMRQMLQLLKVTSQERDEIKDQLQALLDKLVQTNSVNLQPGSPTVGSKVNSGISESESLSETYKHQSYGSSPGDSFFNSVSSPELPSVNWAESGNMGLPDQSFLENYNNSVFPGVASNMKGHNFSMKNAPENVGAFQPGDRFIKVKPLPEKGKLLQAVIEAGPLLQTLLIAGPLPRWRNPPPLQSIQVPAIPIQETNTSSPVRRQVGVPIFQAEVCSSGVNYNGDHQMTRHIPCGLLKDSSSMVSSSLKRSSSSSPDGSYGTEDPRPATKVRKI